MKKIMERITSLLLILTLSIGFAAVGFALDSNMETYAATATSKIKTPVIKSASSGNSDSGSYIKITWTKRSTASKYYIYRAEKKNGKYQKIGSTTKTYYKDRDIKYEKNYYYKVKAIAKKSKYNSNLSKYKKGKYHPNIKTPESEGSVSVVVKPEGEDLYYLSVTELQQLIPEAAAVCRPTAANAPRVANRLEQYLFLTDQFHNLVLENGERNGAGCYFTTHMMSAAIVYDRDNNVCAYYVGMPKAQADNTLNIEFTLCSMETEEMAEKQRLLFEEQKETVFANEIAPEKFKESGVAYYYPTLGGVNLNNSGNRDEWMKLIAWINFTYSTWQENRGHIRTIDTIENLRKNSSEGVGTFCLLLNKKKELIGYTCY